MGAQKVLQIAFALDGTEFVGFPAGKEKKYFFVLDSLFPPGNFFTVNCETFCKDIWKEGQYSLLECEEKHKLSVTAHVSNPVTDSINLLLFGSYSMNQTVQIAANKGFWLGY